MGSRSLTPGDEVVVITGNDKGKTGKIISSTKKTVIVEGINVRKKHLKKTQENQKGQIIEIETPINISNVKPYIDGKAVKLRVRFSKEGAKELYYLDGKKQVLCRPVKKAKR